jgi:hypothetical protein
VVWGRFDHDFFRSHYFLRCCRYSPQLYVAGEFIGGSDIMVEMYRNGELAEMIEKAKAEMM